MADNPESLSKRQKTSGIDYSKCILCQKHDQDTLYNVTQNSVVTLKNAAEARQDVIAFRLLSDLHSDGFLSFRPMWHSQCRNRYLLKKSYELVDQKRLTSFSATSAECDPGPSKIT